MARPAVAPETSLAWAVMNMEQSSSSSPASHFEISRSGCARLSTGNASRRRDQGNKVKALVSPPLMVLKLRPWLSSREPESFQREWGISQIPHAYYSPGSPLALSGDVGHLVWQWCVMVVSDSFQIPQVPGISGWRVQSPILCYAFQAEHSSQDIHADYRSWGTHINEVWQRYNLVSD